MGEGTVHTVRVGDITFNRQRLYPALARNFFGHAFDLGARARSQGYRSALAGESQCDSASNAASAAGD
jgi:hypothetical protein